MTDTPDDPDPLTATLLYWHRVAVAYTMPDDERPERTHHRAA